MSRCSGKREKNDYWNVLDEFQGQGYATEAVKLALKWAFGYPEVFAVEAEADPENVASQKVLEKCGFQATGEIGEEGPRFSVYKKPGSINRS